MKPEYDIKINTKRNVNYRVFTKYYGWIKHTVIYGLELFTKLESWLQAPLWNISQSSYDWCPTDWFLALVKEK